METIGMNGTLTRGIESDLQRAARELDEANAKAAVAAANLKTATDDADRARARIMRLIRVTGAPQAADAPAARPRQRWAMGSLQSAVLSEIGAEPRRMSDVARAIGRDGAAIGCALTSLLKRGAIVRVANGLYARPPVTADGTP